MSASKQSNTKQFETKRAEIANDEAIQYMPKNIGFNDWFRGLTAIIEASQEQIHSF